MVKILLSILFIYNIILCEKISASDPMGTDWVITTTSGSEGTNSSGSEKE